jgi:hypothetical protein
VAHSRRRRRKRAKNKAKLQARLVTRNEQILNPPNWVMSDWAPAPSGERMWRGVFDDKTGEFIVTEVGT